MFKRLALLFLLFVCFLLATSQPGPTEKYLADELSSFSRSWSPYRLTIFVIPSKVQYDWSSPRSLHKSFFKNYKRNFFKKESYLLGHAFLELDTPLEEESVFTGMRAASRKEQQVMVLKEHYGLSILGADMEGRLETRSALTEKVDKFSRKDQMAFITLLISKEAAERMLKFFEVYKSDEEGLSSPQYHYSGAYWPRYHGEGAGCSAFVVSFLDLGGILREEFIEWKTDVNIPMDLMGGPYNEGNEVLLKDIRKRYHWADSTEAFEPFEIYDPTLIYEWIYAIWEDPMLLERLRVMPVSINKARGILIDARQVPTPEQEPIFMEREKATVFVR